MGRGDLLLFNGSSQYFSSKEGEITGTSIYYFLINQAENREIRPNVGKQTPPIIHFSIVAYTFMFLKDSLCRKTRAISFGTLWKKCWTVCCPKRLLLNISCSFMAYVSEKVRSSRCCGLALFHGLVLHIGLTSLHLSPLDRVIPEKLLWLWLTMPRFKL